MNREDQLILILQHDHDVFDALHRSCRDTGLRNPVRFCRNGYEVASYFSGAGIYRRREEYPLPSLFIMALDLPGWDAFDFLRSLRLSDRFEHLPVIGTLPVNHERVIRRAFNLGLTAYYEIPRQIPEVITALRKGDFLRLEPHEIVAAA